MGIASSRNQQDSDIRRALTTYQGPELASDPTSAIRIYAAAPPAYPSKWIKRAAVARHKSRNTGPGTSVHVRRALRRSAHYIARMQIRYSRYRQGLRQLLAANEHRYIFDDDDGDTCLPANWAADMKKVAAAMTTAGPIDGAMNAEAMQYARENGISIVPVAGGDDNSDDDDDDDSDDGEQKAALRLRGSDSGGGDDDDDVEQLLDEFCVVSAPGEMKARARAIELRCRADPALLAGEDAIRYVHVCTVDWARLLAIERRVREAFAPGGEYANRDVYKLFRAICDMDIVRDRSKQPSATSSSFRGESMLFYQPWDDADGVVYDWMGTQTTPQQRAMGSEYVRRTESAAPARCVPLRSWNQIARDLADLRAVTVDDVHADMIYGALEIAIKQFCDIGAAYRWGLYATREIVPDSR